MDEIRHKVTARKITLLSMTLTKKHADTLVDRTQVLKTFAMGQPSLKTSTMGQPSRTLHIESPHYCLFDKLHEKASDIGLDFCIQWSAPQFAT